MKKQFRQLTCMQIPADQTNVDSGMFYRGLAKVVFKYMIS